MNKQYLVHLLLELLKGALLSVLTLLIRELTNFLRGQDGTPEEAWV